MIDLPALTRKPLEMTNLADEIERIDELVKWATRPDRLIKNNTQLADRMKIAWPLFKDALRSAEEVGQLKATLQGLESHAGTTVTWERLRTAHSAMLGEQSWAPVAPNEGHRVYRQSADEQCYMCAALWLIDEAQKKLSAAESRAARAEALLERAITQLQADSHDDDPTLPPDDCAGCAIVRDWKALLRPTPSPDEEGK